MVNNPCMLRVHGVHAVLRMLDSFSTALHISTKTRRQLQHISRFYFITSTKHPHFYLDFGGPFAFWDTDFHKMQGRETLGISRDNVNTIDHVWD
jgi:hypothetical protein